jgi:hypothetical protein
MGWDETWVWYVGYDPKFHHALMLVGIGRSINALFAIFISGWVVRIGLFINLFVVGDLSKY